ncbi:MAG: serine acetyltransferase [Holdemanella sp.]|nr:serine acetyltransferase [Holdemanella sp.]
MNNEVEKNIHDVAQLILDDYKKERNIDQLNILRQPNKDIIHSIVDKLMRIIYPGFLRDPNYKLYTVNNNITALIEDVVYRLTQQICLALYATPIAEDKTKDELMDYARNLSIEFFKRIPEVRELCNGDLQAAYDGDPAAKNFAEIVIAYPGLFTITVNRLAHVLYQMDVPLIPRIMTEYAHQLTGIDIHPGATIGKNFFIDHGTGIVVGETTIIGNNVKVYQGVTIGALSTRGGQKLKGKKRHPTIEDNVTIYAGASILGGDTVIGHDSVVGSNAFLTHSINPGTRVSVKNQELNIKEPPKDETWVYSI